MGRPRADLLRAPHDLVGELGVPLLRQPPVRRRRPLHQRRLAFAVLARGVLASQPPRLPALGHHGLRRVGARPVRDIDHPPACERAGTALRTWCGVAPERQRRARSPAPYPRICRSPSARCRPGQDLAASRTPRTAPETQLRAVGPKTPMTPRPSGERPVEIHVEIVDRPDWRQTMCWWVGPGVGRERAQSRCRSGEPCPSSTSSERGVHGGSRVPGSCRGRPSGSRRRSQWCHDAAAVAQDHRRCGVARWPRRWSRPESSAALAC